MCVKKFFFSKFGRFQDNSRQLYYQMNFVTGIFRQHFKLLTCFDLSPLHQILSSPLMFATPVGDPAFYGVSSLHVLVSKIHIYMPKM